MKSRASNYDCFRRDSGHRPKPDSRYALTQTGHLPGLQVTDTRILRIAGSIALWVVMRRSGHAW